MTFEDAKALRNAMQKYHDSIEGVTGQSVDFGSGAVMYKKYINGIPLRKELGDRLSKIIKGTKKK